MRTEEAEIVVIGGGLVGTSICHRLAEKGLRVVLIERGGIAEEASGRNIGGVRQQSRDLAEVSLALVSTKIWREFHRELEADIEYVVGGNLMLLRSEKELEDGKVQQREEAVRGLQTEILSRDETLRLIPAFAREARLVAGKYCATDGHANPLRVGKAIARAAERLGARVFVHTPATGIELSNGVVSTVRTPEIVFKTPVVVNACNAWAPGIGRMVGLDIPIVPNLSQILLTEPLPPLFRQFVTCTGIGYLRQAVRGNVHIGYPSQPTKHYSQRSTYPAFPYIGRGIATYFPALQSTRILRAWGGLTAFTPDNIPILDAPPEVPGFYIAAGMCGRGFCLGPGIGKVMADWITDGKPPVDLHPYRLSRFQK